MAKVVVTSDFRGIYVKVDKMTNKGQYAFANQALADMTNYVPKLNADLRNSATIALDAKSIMWNTVYAKAQFYGTNGIVTFHKYTTPFTGKRWDLKAQMIHMRSWERVVGRALK